MQLNKHYTLNIECDDGREIKLEHPYSRFTISIWLYTLILMLTSLATNLVELNLFLMIMKLVVLVEMIVLTSISYSIDGYESCMRSLENQFIK